MRNLERASSFLGEDGRRCPQFGDEAQRSFEDRPGDVVGEGERRFHELRISRALNADHRADSLLERKNLHDGCLCELSERVGLRVDGSRCCCFHSSVNSGLCPGP